MGYSPTCSKQSPMGNNVVTYQNVKLFYLNYTLSYPQFVLLAVVMFASARVAPSLTSGLSLVSRLINDGIPSAKGKKRSFQVFQNNVWLRLQVTGPKFPIESNLPYATK